MDNITQTEMLINYGLFCLERQKDVLKAYRKIYREYWELAIVIILAIAATGCAIASIVCATMEIFDGWAAALVFILDGICAAMFAVYAKVTSDNIHEAKAFIAKASDVYTTLEDIIYIVDRMNSEYTEDDTEEEEQ
jgi:hypothetical protein